MHIAVYRKHLLAFAQEINQLEGAKQARYLAAGAVVEVRYGGGQQLFPGVVAAAHPDDGTYDIAYDDGDKEAGVRRDFIMAQWK